MLLRDVIDRPTMHRLAIGGAWFFIVVSLLYLQWAAIELIRSGPGADATFYQTVADGQIVKAVGLSYVGTAGLMLVFLQGAALSAAAIASTLRRDKWRRIGHGVLVGWALLWTLNLLWLTSIDQMVMSYGQSLTMLVLLGFTVYRARVGWNAPPKRTRSDDGPADDAVASGMAGGAALEPIEFEAESLSSVDISHSDRVQEVMRGDAESQSIWRGMWRKAVRSVQWCLTWVVASVDRAWPVVRRSAMIVGGLLQRMMRNMVQFLRGHGFVPRRSTPTARVE